MFRCITDKSPARDFKQGENQMQSERKQISPLLYYILLSGLTDLVFFVVGVAVVSIPSLIIIDNPAVVILAILLLWKGIIVGFITWIYLKISGKKEFPVKFIGNYFGRFFGLFIGGFLGWRIANLLGLADNISTIAACLGAIVLYFTGRRIGSSVSAAISVQLDKLFSISEAPTAKEVIKAKPLVRILLLSIVVIPFTFVVLGFAMAHFGIPAGGYPELLPIARLIVIAISIFSIGYPWFIRKRRSNKYPAPAFSYGFGASWVGLSLSIAPALYGFFLFLAMGAALIELCLFAAASSIAAIIWIVSDPVLKGQIAA
jgi:hypothetical protein